MRKKLMICSLLAVFLMLLLPALSAAEAKVAQSATTVPNPYKIRATYIDALRATYKDNPSPQCILVTLAIILLKLLRWGELFLIGGTFLLIGGILLIIRILRNHNTTGLTC
jgi:hypothetical protein